MPDYFIQIFKPKLKDKILLAILIFFTIRDALKGCGYGNAVQKALEEKGAKADYDLNGDEILDALCPKPTPPPPPPGKQFNMK